jgi:hypothetical protein
MPRATLSELGPCVSSAWRISAVRVVVAVSALSQEGAAVALLGGCGAAEALMVDGVPKGGGTCKSLHSRTVDKFRSGNGGRLASELPWLAATARELARMLMRR